MLRNKILMAFLLVALLVSAIPVTAQVTYNPNADQYMLLGLNQSYIALGQAAKSFLRVKEQYEKGFVAEEAYDTALAQYRNAKVNYDMSLMRVLFNATNVIVQRAVKRVEADGRKVVSVTIRNVAGGTFELSKLKTFGARETELTGGSWSDNTSGSSVGSDQNPATIDHEDLEEAIEATLPFIEGQGLAFEDVVNLLEVNNIFISLSSRSDSGEMVMVSKPFEIMIPKLKQYEEETVRFELLRDVEFCTINLSYGDITAQKPVYLELESATGDVEIRSENPSLQADLDSTATFSIDLERFTTQTTTFALRVVNLPRQIDYFFIDPDNNNQQISTVNFTEGKTRKRVQLQVNMPKRDSDLVRVDEPIAFKALVINANEADEFDRLSSQHSRYVPESEMPEVLVGGTSLTITPKGVGQIEVSASNFYYAIEPDEQVTMVLTVKNTGTGELKEVAIDADMPNNEWNSEIEPKLIPSLVPEDENKVTLVFTPPTEATVGEHNLKVKVEAKTTRNRVIESEDKEVTVEIKPKPEIWSRLILIVLLIGIVLGIVIFGIKLSRR